ncbi:MAG TPA: ADYC domain-containing protein [Kofleriaceae bacterium]|nr:ADYC domain-containing protein [Kofleriaceae bacterium]
MQLPACCVLIACLAACPGPKTATPGVCRESAPPKECIPPREIGSHQGPYLEGRGLERLHFSVPGGAFPPAPGTRLAAVRACGDGPDPQITVKSCTGVAEIPGARGVVACQVDVGNPTPVVTDSEPPAPGICKSQIGGRHDDPDPLHHRGVTMVRGFWDATGAWQDDPTMVTLSCDAEGNAPGTQQFVEADGAVTKCARQWLLDPAALGDAFQACIRMARGDYCGDGHPHTFIGTEVAVSTPRDPMKSSDCGDGLCFEASWSRNGAVCVSRPRWTGPGMGFEGCQDQFAANGALSCRGDPGQAIVFSRSKVHVCSGHQAEARSCTPDADPVCTPH